MAVTLSVANDASAQLTCEDSGEQDFFSKGWIMAQADCGKQELIKDGRSALSGFAKDMIVAGVNSYIPGLGSMLFGGGEDPFAAHAERIINRIDQAETNIIQAIFDNHEREANLSISRVTTDIRLMMQQEFFVKVNNPFVFRDTVSELRTRATDLTWHQGAPDGNFARLTIEDLPKLHTIVLLQGLMIDLVPETALVEQTSAWANATGKSYFDFSNSDLSRVLEEAQEQTLREIDDLIVNDVIPYMTALSDHDLFRRASDARFSEWHLPDFRGRTGNCPDGETWRYDVEGVGEYLHSWYVDTQWYGDPDDEAGRFSHSLDVVMCRFDDFPGLLVMTTPYGGTFHRLGSRAEALDWYESALSLEREFQYREYLITTYGAVRPTLTGWSDLVAGSLPHLNIDQDLHQAIRPSLHTQLYYTMHWNGSGWVDIGNGNVFELNPVEDSYWRYLSVVADPENLEMWDRRWAMDRVLSYGHIALGLIGIAPTWYDGLGREYPSALLGDLLKVEPERDATQLDRVAAARHFYEGQFAAKYDSLM